MFVFPVHSEHTCLFLVLFPFYFLLKKCSVTVFKVRQHFHSAYSFTPFFFNQTAVVHWIVIIPEYLSGFWTLSAAGCQHIWLWQSWEASCKTWWTLAKVNTLGLVWLKNNPTMLQKKILFDFLSVLTVWYFFPVQVDHIKCAVHTESKCNATGAHL